MQKNMVCKGEGVTKKMAFKFSSDSVCNNANNSARRLKKSVSKVLKIQIFPGGNAPVPPYFTIHLTATPPHQLFHYKIQPGECEILFWPRLV